jgi:hypothetical protein
MPVNKIVSAVSNVMRSIMYLKNNGQNGLLSSEQYLANTENTIDMINKLLYSVTDTEFCSHHITNEKTGRKDSFTSPINHQITRTLLHNNRRR